MEFADQGSVFIGEEYCAIRFNGDPRWYDIGVHRRKLVAVKTDPSATGYGMNDSRRIHYSDTIVFKIRDVNISLPVHSDIKRQ